MILRRKKDSPEKKYFDEHKMNECYPNETLNVLYA
jgi:hypothetical protein